MSVSSVTGRRRMVLPARPYKAIGTMWEVVQKPDALRTLSKSHCIDFNVRGGSRLPPLLTSCSDLSFCCFRSVQKKLAVHFVPIRPNRLPRCDLWISSVALQHRQHTSDERVTDHVSCVSRTTATSSSPLEFPHDRGQSGQFRRQVGLVGIAGHYHGRMPAQPRQQHLELAVRCSSGPRRSGRRHC